MNVIRFNPEALGAGCPLANVMRSLAAEAAELRRCSARAGRNDPCWYASRLKYKCCHRRLRDLVTALSRSW